MLTVVWLARKVSEEEIKERMLYSLINEGFKVLEDGIALRPGDIDVVWIYGYGFPRHKGGPMHFADEHGLGRILASLEKFAEAHPDQLHLEPSALLRECVESGRLELRMQTPGGPHADTLLLHKEQP